MRKSIIVIVCVLGISIQAICGKVSILTSNYTNENKENSDFVEQSLNEDINENSTLIQKVRKKMKYKDLTKEKKKLINYCVKKCVFDGKRTAYKLNQLAVDEEEFQIGIRKILNKFYKEKNLKAMK